MHHQPFTGTDMGNNRVTGNRTAAFSEGNQYAICTFDRQFTALAVAADGVAVSLQQVLRHHHAHRIAQTDFCQ